jgi:holo-ACP synthase
MRSAILQKTLNGSISSVSVFSEFEVYMEHFLLSDTEKEELKQFIGAEAELPDMLNARERRVWVQEKLLAEYSGVLVSFTLNIPGPVKVLPYVPETFELALKEILQALSASGIPVLKRSLILDRTGPEAFLCVDADALDVKRLLVPLEEMEKSDDIDIIGRDGKKISRSDIGKPGRTCLLCGRPARECSRSRTHSVAELTSAIEKIFKENFAG